jgi:hypothetical protein
MLAEDVQEIIVHVHGDGNDCVQNLANPVEAVAAGGSGDCVEAANPPPAPDIIISSSKRKLSYGRGDANQPAQASDSPLVVTPANAEGQRQYIIADVSQINKLLSSLQCPDCGERLLKFVTEKQMGFASEMILSCTGCNETIKKCYSSPRCLEKNADGTFTPGKHGHGNYEINLLLVFLMHELGLGFAAIKKTCSILGIPCMADSTYEELSKYVGSCTIQECKSAMQEAVQIVKTKYSDLPGAAPDAENISDIDVSYDASWQKRGYSSHHGLGLIIDLLTGLCLDFSVKSNFCLECLLKAEKLGENSREYQEWYEGHRGEHCSKNHEGTAGSMEQAIAHVMWTRSVDENKLRYITFLSDGDSKSYNHVRAAQPYGPDKLIHKEECVNHVGKRLGTALRNLRKAKKLGGRGEGRLTDKVIDKLQIYYTRAIRKNVGNPEQMHKDVLCTLLHHTSTDETPRHRFCPPGDEENGWCFFNNAVAKGEQPGPHADNMTFSLAPAVTNEMRPVYMRLSDNELMERCRRGKTQNPNEGLHSLIWRRCPKTVFVGRKRIEEATASAVGYSNKGTTFIQDMMKNMGIRPSHIGDEVLKDIDEIRIKKSQLKATEEAQRRRPPSPISVISPQLLKHHPSPGRW